MSQLLNDCDKTDLRTVGEIQSFASLLVFNAEDLKMVAQSENFERAKDQAFIPDASPEFKSKMTQFLKSGQKSVHWQMEDGFKRKDLHLFSMTDKLFGLEIEEDSNFLNHKAFVESASKWKSPESADRLCREIRKLIRFERVMIYQFQDNWDGQVIAEDKGFGAQSFLHHFFPASDIPLPARKMYEETPYRYIPDIKDPSSQILAITQNDSLPAMNLIRAYSRGVVPVHIEYLQNMGVRASFSLPIIYEGKLWGLVACHHSAAQRIPRELREALSVYFKEKGHIIPDLNLKAHGKVKKGFENGLENLTKTESGIFETFIPTYGRKILNLFNAQSLIVFHKDEVDFIGQWHPSWKGIFNKLTLNWELGVLYKESTENAPPDLSLLLAGFMGIREGDFLMILGREKDPRIKVWAGDPMEKHRQRGYKGNINPRKSFETKLEKQSKSARPWEKWEEDGLASLVQWWAKDLD